LYKLFDKLFIIVTLVLCGVFISEITCAYENSPFDFSLDNNIVPKQLMLKNTGISKDFQNKTIRVLLSNKGSFEQKELILSSEDELFLTSNNQLILNTNSSVKVSIQGDYFLIEADGILKKVLVNQKLLVSTESKPIAIENFSKLNDFAKYKGNLELSLSKNNKIKTINVIDIEDYIKGVVPNEMPVYFGLEALKAQAISARGYAYRDASYKNANYDVCDTTGSQVYNGFNSYDKISNQAVDETMGQFALYDSKVILSLYSSTAGGHTENYENAFSQNGVDTKFPATPIPYLKGVPDYNYDIDLSREKNAKDFYTQDIKSFENKSPKYRWSYSWKKEELEDILAKNLVKFSSSKFVTPSIKNISDFGELQNIDIPKRGVSGKAMYVRITTDKGVFIIAKEITIRKIFEYNKRWLPSANVVFEAVKDGKKLIGYKIYGGGFGHGVGLSQFGAAGMAQQGYTYDAILKHYYTGISIGSYPVECKLDNIQNCNSTFYSHNKNAKLILTYSHKPHDLTFSINGNNVIVSAENFDKKTGEIDIRKFLKKGINTIKLISCDSNALNFSANKVKFYVELEGKHEK